MKKLLPFSLTAILILAFALSGCGGGNGGGGTNYTPGELSTYTVGGVSFNMRYAPSDSLTSDDCDISGDENLPVAVTVANAYWMAETEVTYELWLAVYTWATDAAREDNQYTFANSGAGVADQHPVTDVSWRDAMVWCNALSEMAGLTPVYKNGGVVVRDSSTANATVCDGVSDPIAGDKGFRLPTSNEWQLAARYEDGTNWTPGSHVSGDTTSYCSPSDAGTSTVFGDYAVYTGNRAAYSTNSVKSTPQKNALGLYDMSGNVWEWCFDWYPEYSDRVRRGGGWNDGASALRIGLVECSDPGNYQNYLGFRPVRTQ